MKSYSAVRGNNVQLYIGEELLCTARHVEIATEQVLHEVYECFSDEPAAVIKGRKKYTAILERLTLEGIDRDMDFLRLDNFTVKIIIDGKATVLTGCSWSNDAVQVDAEGIIERLRLSAVSRLEENE